MAKKKEGVEEKLDYLIEYVTGEGLREDLAQTFPTRQELDEQFKQIDERFDEFNEKFNKIMEVLDAHTKMLKDLNQERLFQLHRLDRLEGEVNKIKAHLGMEQNS